MPAQVLGWRAEVALALSTVGGRVNRYAKHVFNCLKPRDVLYLTTAYFKVCQLWGVSELAVSLSEHAHENNCAWLILITAGWGQILGCVDGFYYAVLKNCLSKKSLKLLAVWKVCWGKGVSAGVSLPSHHSELLSGGVAASAAAHGVCVSAESTWNWEWAVAGGEDDWWLLLLPYSLSSTCCVLLTWDKRVDYTNLKGLFLFKVHSFCLIMQWCFRLCLWLE